MPRFHRGTAAIALVVSLGLIAPGSFGEPASADVSRDFGIQPMTIECEALGDTVYEVISIDHDPGGKMATLQDLNSSLVFVPQSGSVTSIYTAIENNEEDPEIDDSSPEARVALGGFDPRLAGGYPVSFEIPAGHPYAYFGDGFSRGNKTNKKNLVDCIVIDVGKANAGTVCLANGLPQNACFENWYVADDFDASVTDCVVGDTQDKCFVEGVTYHYEDIIAIKAHVSNNGGAKAKTASVDDAPSADGQHKNKGKKGKQNRGKGKRGR